MLATIPYDFCSPYTNDHSSLVSFPTLISIDEAKFTKATYHQQELEIAGDVGVRVTL
jgi:hypothetical protein